MTQKRQFSPRNGTHKASLRHLPGLAVVLTATVLLGIVAPLAGRSYVCATAVAVLATTLAWRFSAMRLVFTESAILHRGWLRRHEIPFAAIERISRPNGKGWPYDRLLGPSVFEIVTSGAHVRINLLWFGPDGAREFYDRVLARWKWRDT